MHGSLARAGKVRSQTPKVAKAEKKKNPKGRAAQRVKYNRRFVNVGELLAKHALPQSLGDMMPGMNAATKAQEQSDVWNWIDACIRILSCTAFLPLFLLLI